MRARVKKCSLFAESVQKSINDPDTGARAFASPEPSWSAVVVAGTGSKLVSAANGSSGVLPKPTKLSDLKNALLDGVPTFLANGSCVQRGNGVFHAFGELQLADRRR